MKITDSDNIKSGENEFIDGLIGELDWSVIESLLKEKYNLKLHDDVEYKNGDIVVHGNKVAYKLDFDVRVTLSLLLGRDGECFEVTTSGNHDEDEGEIKQTDFNSDEISGTSDDDYIEHVTERMPDKKKEKMASLIAGMINEINE